MVERLLKLRVPLYNVLHNKDVIKCDRKQLELQESTWKVLEDITPILSPLAEATELLTTEDLPNAGSVIILLRQLLSVDLKIDDTDSALSRSLKSTLQEKIQARFNLRDLVPLSLTSPLVIAMALDPRYKGLKFLGDKVEEVNDFILCMMEPTGSSQPNPVKEEPGLLLSQEDQPATKKRLCDSLLGDLVVDLTESSDYTYSKELEDFQKETVRIRDPLQWWKINEGRFPHLAHLARKYLTIQATEVSSERIFSAAGHTITKLRAGLDGDTADKLIFLHKNGQHKFPSGVPPPILDKEDPIRMLQMTPMPMEPQAQALSQAAEAGTATRAGTQAQALPQAAEAGSATRAGTGGRSRSRAIKPELPSMADSQSSDSSDTEDEPQPYGYRFRNRFADSDSEEM